MIIPEIPIATTLSPDNRRARMAREWRETPGWVRRLTVASAFIGTCVVGVSAIATADRIKENDKRTAAEQLVAQEVLGDVDILKTLGTCADELQQERQAHNEPPNSYNNQYGYLTPASYDSAIALARRMHIPCEPASLDGAYTVWEGEMQITITEADILPLTYWR